MAACWKLPVVYVIENNHYAETTSICDTCMLPNIADRSSAYGIPGKTVDGNDVLVVYEAVNEAITKARKGEGPTLIECKTWRYYGHFEGDQQTYKTKEEVEDWMKKDPIPRFKKKLLEMGIFTENGADKIAQEVSMEIEEAVKFAQESPYPAPEETLEDVYT